MRNAGAAELRRHAAADGRARERGLPLPAASLPIAPYLVVAGTDSRSMTPVADDVYRFQAIGLASGEIKMIHGTNEHMTLANLEGLIRYYARLIATAAG